MTASGHSVKKQIMLSLHVERIVKRLGVPKYYARYSEKIIFVTINSDIGHKYYEKEV